MPLMGIREFSRKLSSAITSVEETGRPLVLTRNGRAVAAVVKLDAAAFEDFVISNAPSIAADLRDAERDLAAGDTASLDEVVHDLDTLEAKEDASRSGATRSR
jgi:PHD/YefM family antitoxin component YafN of YafNO toxin-antitoxin module